MRELTLVIRNLAHRKLRAGLLLGSIVIAFLLYGLLISFHLSATGSTGVGADRLIVANKINFTQSLPVSYVDRIRTIPGVRATTFSSWFGGYYREPRNFVVSLAVDFDTYFAVFPEIAMPQEQVRACQQNRNGLAVGKPIADMYGWKLGQTLGLQSSVFQRADGARTWEFVVCGIFTDAAQRGGDNGVYLGWKYLNETRSFDRDTVGLVSVMVKGSQESAGVSEAIDHQFTNSAAETETVTEQQFAAALARQFGDIKLIVTLVVGSAFVTILLIVGTTMATAVRERSRDIGVLKVLGFSKGRVLRLVISETMLLATFGSIVGLALAHLLLLLAARYPSLGGLHMGMEVWATGLLWAALLGLLTSLVPALQALHLNIVAALGRR
ncbi:ABC transporter permease [Sphingomonas sp.]|uniref:ABC transporter permease n=1 Tax=Sphingomonas sp. TaxID=28214 RepID=UPI003D6CC4A5